MQAMFMFLSLIIGMDTFLDEEQKNEVISILPKIQDSIINSRIKSDSVYFYSDKTMPKAYQDFEGALRGIHSPSYNISANYSEPFGNGNIEFPWGKPAGMHRVKNFSELKLYGTEIIINPIYTNTNNFNAIVYNTNEKQFPPRLYDSVRSDNYTPLAGNELYGVYPATIIKQTLMINNQGNYIIYSSTSTSDINYQKNLLFNYNLSDTAGGHWKTGQYTSPSGDYSANTSYIKSDFKGDWIIIKFPYSIILNKFIFNARSATG
jgi:hypothetical protein